jgi:hypothetical protein
MDELNEVNRTNVKKEKCVRNTSYHKSTKVSRIFIKKK